MNYLPASSSKGQLKIQQMAFVLVAMIIFFAFAGLFYFSIRYSSLKEDAESLREQDAIETVRKMSGTAEFLWNVEDCSSCVDFDKILMLKNRTSYQGFWRNIAFLQVTRVYPTFDGVECTNLNYPNCDTVTIIKKEKDLRGHSAFVSLCRFEEIEKYNRCDLGKIVMGFETVR